MALLHTLNPRAVTGAMAAGFFPALLATAAVLAPLSAAAQQDNNVPEFDSGLATTISVDENTAVNTDIGSPYTATDADDDTLTYSLEGDDSSNFRINNSGQLRTGAHLDYEAKTSHSVTVKVSDDTDAATLDVTINIMNESDTGGDSSLTPSSSDASVARKSRATYSIRIEGNWTSSVSPGGLPGGAHFTTFVGGIHNDQVTFLDPGGSASAGVEFMAELGGTSTLVSEVNAQEPNAERSITLGTPGVNSSRTHNNVTFTSDHPRITLTSMVAPSPDWFVGVSGRSLLDSSGEWLPSLTVNLYPWDAGTENGTEFSLSNTPTNPKGVITSLRGRGKFTGARIARLVFTHTGSIELAPAAPTGFEATPSDGEVTLEWDVPTATGISGHEYRRKSDGAYGAWTAIGDSAPSGANENSFTVDGLDNNTQYTFQLRARNSVGGGVASAEMTATPTQGTLPELVLNLGAIAGDNTVNITEKASGFSIGGDTGSEGGVLVTVSVGDTDLNATSSTADPATWSVSVPGNASYITGTSVDVEVNATKTGFTSPSAVERTLTVDLTAPEAPTYTAPLSLQVGVAIAPMSPSGGSGIDTYSATGLPSGLRIDAGTGAISGTPDTAEAGTADATVTARDTAGNIDTVSITFPAVAKGGQTLTGFQYSSSAITLDSTAPTVTAPSGAQTTVSYSASPVTVCTVNASTGALTLVGVGECVITVTAEDTDNYNEATDTYMVRVQAAGTLVLNLGAIAGDNTVNITEKASGFSIGGDTGSEGGVLVTVSVGDTDLNATSSTADPATWSVSVPGNASYITGTSVDVEVNATKTGFTSPSAVERTLTVDLTAPEAPTYTAPLSLQVGVAIAPMSPSGGSGIDTYSATGLPSGLRIDAGTGAISGTPDTAEAGTADATVTARDTAGNIDTVSITFPAVAKGGQTLTGFQYSSSAITLDSTAPTVTAPSGAQTTVSYSASPVTVCTVNASTGALTLVGVGECVITVTAEDTDNYNEATDTYTVRASLDEALLINITLVVSDENFDEAEATKTVRVTAKLDHEPFTTDTAVTVSVGASSDSATEGADYATVNDLTVKIPAGQTSGVSNFSLTTSVDDLDEADETISVSGTTTAIDLIVTGTMITIADDDDRGVEVTPVSLDISEGSTATYTVVLTSEPTGDVTVTPSVTGSADVSVNASSLTFNRSNWDIAQMVRVLGAQDTDVEEDTATIGHTVSGADYGDNNVVADDVTVTVTDDDIASTGIALTVSDEYINEDEDTTTVTVTAALDHASLATDTAVTVSVGASSDTAAEGADYATVNDLTLTISAGDTTGTATFSLTPDDDDVDEIDETLTLSGATSAAGLTVTGTTITIADNDERGVNLRPASRFISEGGSSTYSVVLTSQPTGSVTMTPSVNGSADVTLDVSSLTFNTLNWNSVQTVTVSAGQDSDEVNDTATIEHSVSGADYGDNTVTADDVAVTVGDDETVSTGITLSVSPQEIGEAAGAKRVTVTGTLSNAPLDSDTSVAVSIGTSSDSAAQGTDYSPVSDLALTIKAGNTTGTVSFALTPVDNDVDGNDKVLSVGGTADGLEVTDTTITINDDETRGISVSAVTLSLKEGGSASYTVVLQSRPTGTVTVKPSVQGDSDVTLSPASLYFNWKTWVIPKTVTVSTVGDADAQDGEAIVEYTAAGGDYGSERSSEISVRVRDNFQYNNAPVFPAVLLRRLKVAENSAADTAIGAPFEATDLDGGTLVYALEGMDAGGFAIDPQSGQLKTLAELDHESQVSYSVTVTVDDSHGGHAAMAVTLNVTDIDEQAGTPKAPVVLATPGSMNSLRLRWSAPELNGGPPITGYGLQYREGVEGAWRDHRHTGTDTRATITGLAAATDYQARVRALNGEAPGEWSEPGAGHPSKADNNAPVFDFGLTTELSVEEHTAAGADLGAPFAATDTDGDTLTYLLDGADRNVFSIDPQSGQLRTRAALDHEYRANYSVTVRADDGNGSADSLAVTVSVTDIGEQAGTPEAPVVLSAMGSTTSLEMNWSAPDAKGGPAIAGYGIQYRQGDEGDWIDHRHTATRTRTVINYLTTATPYQARVRALNGEIPSEWSGPGAGNTGNWANTPPVFADGLPGEVALEENNIAEIGIGAPFAATDADGDTLTYLLDGADRNAFSIDPATGQLRTRAALDHEEQESRSVKVWVNDGRGGTDSVTVRVRVVDVDEQAPPLSAPGVLATADSTTSLDLRWTAPARTAGPPIENYEVQYRAGSAGAWISHAQDSVETRSTIADLVTATDYQARVRALNGEIPGEWSEPGAGSTGRADNNAPVFDSVLPAMLTVNENTRADSDIGSPFVATDTDGDTLTYLLDGPDRGAFAIDPDSAQLRTRASLDHEAKSSYSLRVRVNDGAGGADKMAVAVQITDLQEKPARTLAPWVLSAVDTTTSLDLRWSAPDADGGPSIVGYAVQYREGTDGAWIDHPHAGADPRATIADLVAATGYQVRVRALNGETPGDWSPPGTGSTGNTDNNAPEFSSDTATRSIAENSEAGNPIGAAVRAVDIDRDSLTYFLEGADADAFEFEAQTGQIRTKAALDYEAKASYVVMVVANDGNGGVDTIDVTIELIDLQEAQAALGPAAPTGVRLGQQLSLDAGQVVQAQVSLRWEGPASEETSWFEFRLGRYPESSNGLAPPPFQCAGNRSFEPDGWQRIPDSGPEGVNARSYRFDAQALGCHVLPDTFELRAQVRAVFAGEESASPRTSAPSTEARMRDEAPRVVGSWLDSTDANLPETGEELVFVVAFTEPVKVVAADDSPTLEIKLGDATRQAGFAGAAKPPAFRLYGSGLIGSELQFRYRVQSSDDLTSGIFVPANAISVSDGATIVDATGPGGHAADLRSAATTIAENTTVLAAAAEESLKASFEPESVPEAHDGETAFTVQVRFEDSTSTGDEATEQNDSSDQGDQEDTGASDGLGGLMLSEASFLVTGGRATDVSRLVEGENQRWVVSIEPDSKFDVSISLGPALECAEEGAVCTDDGRRLANNIHAVIKGPPGLSAADAQVAEGPDATMDFIVTVSRALPQAVSVEYATIDGTATAGLDYTAASGTLTFDAGEITKTVSVVVLDDAHDDDGETFTLTLSNPSGSNACLVNAVATGTIENSDPMPKAWIARFGRAVSDHVVDAIQTRFRDSSREAHLTLGGLRMDGLFGHRDVGARQRYAGMDRLFGGAGGLGGGNLMDGAPEYTEPWGSDLAPATASYPGGSLAGGGFANDDGPQGAMYRPEGSGSGPPSLKELLMGSSFYYSSADHEQDADASGLKGRKRWSAWGRTARTHFHGDDGPLSLDGEVATGMLGVDAGWNRWLAGVVLARSEGKGGYAHETASGGIVTSTLSSLHPFAQYRFSSRTSVWATIGYGMGGLSLTPEDATSSVDADLRMSMAALGGRGVLSVRTGTSGSFELAVRSDAMLTETHSGASENLLSAAGATSRLRVMLEGSGSMSLATGSVLTPALEAGFRYDGGDAETGAGLEIGAGLAYASGRFSVQVNVRGLLAHQDAQYKEWGFGGSLVYLPSRDGRGLTLKLGSEWGATQSGVQSLWSRAGAAGTELGGAAMGAAQQFQAQVGYGVFGPKGHGLWVPYIAADTSETGAQALWLGVRFTSSLNLDAGFEIGHRTSIKGQPENAIKLSGVMRW